MTAPAVHVQRRTARAAMALAASEILGKIATLVFFMVCARVLGLEEFGVFSLGLGIGLLLAMLPSMGLNARLVQLASAEPECLDACLGALLRIRLVVSAAISAPIVGVISLTHQDADHFAALLMMVFASLIDTFSDAFRAACGARQRQHRTAVILVVQRLLSLVLLVALLAVWQHVWAAALAYLVSILFGLVGMADAARRVGARPQLRGVGHEVRRLLAAARVLGLESVVTMGLFRIDTVIISILLGHAAVGAYSAAYRLLEAVLFVSWTLSRAYVPVIASQAGDRRAVREWARRCMVVVFLIYLPYGVVLAVAGDDLLVLLFGSEFVVPLLMLSLAAAPLLFGIAHLQASVLLARRPDPVVLNASIAALAVNVVLNLVLLPTWGVVGAGVATTAAFLVQGLILTRTLTTLVGSVFEPQRIGLVAAAAVGAGVAMLVPAPTLLAVAAGGIAYVAIWTALSTTFDPPAVAQLRSIFTRGARSEGAP